MALNNKSLKLLSILILPWVLMLAACGGPNYPEPETDAKEFYETHFSAEGDEIDSYLAIEYEDRTYIPYGTIGRTLFEKDVDSCIGYLVQDGRADKDERVYTLTEDPEHNYLMEYYIGTKLMNSPMFWRATDTVGQDIATPSFIHSLEYDYWN